jgi:CubicO group peptidase (beta-lactamase class C family)
MALASVSKSITAAAVVRELGLKGIPLTAPFAGTAAINGVPNMASVPSIADVLRNLGGFAPQTASYGDHSLINMSYPIDGKKMYDYVVNAHLDTNDGDSYWDYWRFVDTQIDGKLRYSNPGFSMLGELVRVQSGVPYVTYVRDNLLAPLNLHQEIYPDPGHRNAVVEPTQAGLRSYLINDAHPYVEKCSTDANCSYLPGGMCGVNNTCTGCTMASLCQGGATCIAGECTPVPTTPRLASQVVPGPANGDNSPIWDENVGPVDPSTPADAAVQRYAGGAYLGGAPLAAGGWHADGESLGIFIRVLAQYDFLMPFGTARQLWDPQWWNFNHNRGAGWAYGLGWYVRGNWVAMAGGTDGAMATVLHNRRWDFTVVILTNVVGNGFGEIFAPLFFTQGGWGTSIIGGQFPCGDDPATTSGNECGNLVAVY